VLGAQRTEVRWRRIEQLYGVLTTRAPRCHRDAVAQIPLEDHLHRKKRMDSDGIRRVSDGISDEIRRQEVQPVEHLGGGDTRLARDGAHDGVGEELAVACAAEGRVGLHDDAVGSARLEQRPLWQHRVALHLVDRGRDLGEGQQRRQRGRRPRRQRAANSESVAMGVECCEGMRAAANLGKRIDSTLKLAQDEAARLHVLVVL